jgi:hypothetical protein
MKKKITLLLPALALCALAFFSCVTTGGDTNQYQYDHTKDGLSLDQAIKESAGGHCRQTASGNPCGDCGF